MNAKPLDEFNTRDADADLKLLWSISNKLRKASYESPIAMHTILRGEVETSALGGFMRARWKEGYSTWLPWDQYMVTFAEAFLMGVQFEQQKEDHDRG